MVDGILVVNLDPPYVGFVQNEKPGDNRRKFGTMKDCTLSELRATLIELGAITSQQQWPPKDCAIRVPGTFSDAALIKAGLGASLRIAPAKQLVASKKN